jgi:hypothetical protein
VQNSQTVGHHLKFLSLRKPFMLGKNGIKLCDNIFPQKLTLTFLGDHSLTPCIFVPRYIQKRIARKSFSLGKLHAGWLTKNLWCCILLIFYPIWISDTSNEIILKTLHYQLIKKKSSFQFLTDEHQLLLFK